MTPGAEGVKYLYISIAGFTWGFMLFTCIVYLRRIWGTRAMALNVAACLFIVGVAVSIAVETYDVARHFNAGWTYRQGYAIQLAIILAACAIAFVHGRREQAKLRRFEAEALEQFSSDDDG